MALFFGRRASSDRSREARAHRVVKRSSTRGAAASAVTLALLLSGAGCGPIPEAGPADRDSAARKARILANLEEAFPQLAQMEVIVGEIGPSDYPGLDAGSYTVVNPRGVKRTLTFFVSADDQRFYLITGKPLDVSRSAEEIEAERRRDAAERRPRLEAAVAGLPLRGNPEAPVLIVEFSDFECPYCARAAAAVEQVLDRHGDEVRFAFKHFPLPNHPWARPAAIAAQCAALQEPAAFWTLHDAYFRDRQQITPANLLARSREYLAASGIDLEAFTACAGDEASSEHRQAAASVDADVAVARELGLTGTPTFFVGGELLKGPQSLSAFEPLISRAKGAG